VGKPVGVKPAGFSLWRKRTPVNSCPVTPYWAADILDFEAVDMLWITRWRRRHRSRFDHGPFGGRSQLEGRVRTQETTLRGTMKKAIEQIADVYVRLNNRRERAASLRAGRRPSNPGLTARAYAGTFS
jgi:hypothetical protein